MTGMGFWYNHAKFRGPPPEMSRFFPRSKAQNFRPQKTPHETEKHLAFFFYPRHAIGTPKVVAALPKQHVGAPKIFTVVMSLGFPDLDISSCK